MTCGIWGCILFESKEYTPRPPKKDFGGIANFPPVPPLKRPKAGGCGPLLWNPAPGGGRGYGYGGSTLGAFGRTVGGGLCPAPGGGRRDGVTDSHVAALLGMTGRRESLPLFFVIARRPAGAPRRSVLLLAVWVWEACPGGHIGPPLRNVGGLENGAVPCGSPTAGPSPPMPLRGEADSRGF